MSNESSAIAPWQLLWSKISTRLQPSVNGYFTSAISTAFVTCSMNFSEVQYPSLDSPYSRNILAHIQIWRWSIFALSYSSRVRERQPFFSSTKFDTMIPAPFPFGLSRCVSFFLPKCWLVFVALKRWLIMEDDGLLYNLLERTFEVNWQSCINCSMSILSNLVPTTQPFLG